MAQALKHLWVNTDQGEHAKVRCGRVLKLKDTVLKRGLVTCSQCKLFYDVYDLPKEKT